MGEQVEVGDKCMYGKSNDITYYISKIKTKKNLSIEPVER